MHAPTTTTATVPPPEKTALVPAAVPWSWEAVRAFGADPSRWKAWALDLYSDRLVPWRVAAGPAERSRRGGLRWRSCVCIAEAIE
ncbi:hypothetical protein SPI_01152 [Niveomyces insectorum RCEF 264]|uniref:Uncharacterized protein n=1 Tax=Niveomyces insectorum RCEF 264 TaxID=1081102 RepID=A0A167YQJ4_9HYPO|nr:hypothetical protein SPI_01152 [Niveomyces insectorum RCEF 264]